MITHNHHRISSMSMMAQRNNFIDTNHLLIFYYWWFFGNKEYIRLGHLRIKCCCRYNKHKPCSFILMLCWELMIVVLIEDMASRNAKFQIIHKLNLHMLSYRLDMFWRICSHASKNLTRKQHKLMFFAQLWMGTLCSWELLFCIGSFVNS